MDCPQDPWPGEPGTVGGTVAAGKTEAGSDPGRKEKLLLYPLTGQTNSQSIGNSFEK